MISTIVTTNGRVVIPSKTRKRLNLKKGTRLSVTERGNRVILQPLTDEYFAAMAGILPTKGKLTRDLLAERARKDRK